MTPDDAWYAHYVAVKHRRHHQLMGIVAEDWAQRRWDYWPDNDGVGPYDLREPKQ